MADEISVADYAAANGLTETEALILLGNKCRRGELVGFAVGGETIGSDSIGRLRYYPGGEGRARADILTDNRPKPEGSGLGRDGDAAE